MWSCQLVKGASWWHKTTGKLVPTHVSHGPKKQSFVVRHSNRRNLARCLVADAQLGVTYLMPGRLSSPLHITCLALTNNLAIFPCSRRANIVTLPESLSLFSRGDFEKRAGRFDVRHAMTASVLLHSHWIDPVMFLYENGLDERSKTMEGFTGSNFPANQCRNLLAHPTSLAPNATYASNDAPLSGIGEPGKQCSPCPAAQSSPNASLPYGYFGSSYYPCRVSHGGVKACAQPSGYGDKYMDSQGSGEEFSSRAKEYAFYQGYSPAPYQPSYLDVPVVPALSAPSETRHEPLIPMEPYQPWTITNGWSGQVYCTKEQPQSNPLWKSSLQGIHHLVFMKRCSPLPLTPRAVTV